MRLLACALFALTFACEAKSGSSKPTGTPTDPVEKCERLADVCRYKGSQLGVCIKSTKPNADFTCAPQH